jgi:hypothetical protein
LQLASKGQECDRNGPQSAVIQNDTSSEHTGITTLVAIRSSPDQPGRVGVDEKGALVFGVPNIGLTQVAR